MVSEVKQTHGSHPGDDQHQLGGALLRAGAAVQAGHQIRHRDIDEPAAATAMK
jgi:hypothetical protein